MSRHVRTTITIPPDLKARMEEVDQPVNWSAVAAEAFERKLAEFITRRGPENMREAIDRLRASYFETRTSEYQDGMEMGRQWAMQEAEAPQLIRLFNKHSSLWSRSEEWVDLFRDDPDRTYTVHQWLYFLIDPENDGDRGAADEFWAEHTSGNEVSTGEWYRGFAEGAISVWDTVQASLKRAPTGLGGDY